MIHPRRWTAYISNPNALTGFRIAASPLIIILMMFPDALAACLLAAVIFSAAAITDYFDGHFAREQNLVSNFGKVMDPLADKLLVSSTFIMLTAAGRVPAWIACLIIGREMAITGLRNIVAEKGLDVSASALGKYKTGFQIACLIPLLMHFPILTIDFHVVGSRLLVFATIMTVWSGIDYFARFRSLLME